MKYVLFVFLFALLQVCSSAQSAAFLDIDAKKEFKGIPFLSTTDYSKLQYKNRSPLGFNIYTLKGAQFKTDSFTLPEVFVSIQKGRIMNFLMPIQTESDYSAIFRALTGAFETKTDLGKNKVFHGDNIIFNVFDTQGKYLFMATGKPDTVPDIKDKSGIIDLLGKKITDPSVVQFISSVPGKQEKTEYQDASDITWPGEGLVFGFKGKGDEAVFSYIIVYFMKDNYYWNKKPFKGAIPLPYGITAGTSQLELRDMFGEEAPGAANAKNKTYRKFRTYCIFGDPVKQTDSHLLNHITFQ
ncbi:MAG: hypothetical protein JNK14_20690 [Chitinophagaceae bacterium]|nr:hypothetical protein [Chitinophagaceae bacterium]